MTILLVATGTPGGDKVTGLLHGAECKIVLVLCIVTFLGAAIRPFQKIRIRLPIAGGNWNT
jgi:hypothetical protein